MALGRSRSGLKTGKHPNGSTRRIKRAVRSIVHVRYVRILRLRPTRGPVIRTTLGILCVNRISQCGIVTSTSVIRQRTSISYHFGPSRCELIDLQFRMTDVPFTMRTAAVPKSDLFTHSFVDLASPANSGHIPDGFLFVP